MLDDKKIEEILEHGNTAEVKKTKKGVIILEVARKIRYEDESDEDQTESDEKAESTEKTARSEKSTKTEKKGDKNKR
jgi:hypothetical protein